MFFMATTDLDRFRSFIFNSSFLQIYELDPETLENIRTDDIALMKFSFQFLASSLFGTQGMKISEEKIAAKVEEHKKKQSEAEKRAEETYFELKQLRDQMQKDKKIS